MVCLFRDFYLMGEPYDALKGGISPDRKALRAPWGPSLTESTKHARQAAACWHLNYQRLQGVMNVLKGKGGRGGGEMLKKH